MGGRSVNLDEAVGLLNAKKIVSVNSKHLWDVDISKNPILLTYTDDTKGGGKSR